MPLKYPGPWFGGKSVAAHLILQGLGNNIAHYIEPFCGTMATLLHLDDAPAWTETVNDANFYLANANRSIRWAPAETARWAAWPTSEADLHARHVWLQAEGRELLQRVYTDPDFYNPKCAGWWLWGLSNWIGSGWCEIDKSSRKASSLDGMVGDVYGVGSTEAGAGTQRKIPEQLPHLLHHGKGTQRKIPEVIPHVATWRGTQRAPGILSQEEFLAQWFARLARRLECVRIVCGDWRRVLTPAASLDGVLGAGHCIGIVFDPPYTHPIDADVRAWALAHGDSSRYRIVLCGYEGTHIMPENWQCVQWQTAGGYGRIGNKQGRINKTRERIWFSPHCETVTQQLPLFPQGEAEEPDGNSLLPFT